MECEIILCKYWKDSECELSSPTLKVIDITPLTHTPMVTCANYEQREII